MSNDKVICSNNETCIKVNCLHHNLHIKTDACDERECIQTSKIVHCE